MKTKTKIKAGILGATGLIGQAFVKILSSHPLFTLSMLSGSRTGTGEKYGDAVTWRLPSEFPAGSGDLIIERPDPSAMKKRGVRYLFSALPSAIAGHMEAELREEGFFIFSNAGARRYDKDVPILVPDVNPGSLELIREQGFPGKGFIVTNPNCSTAGLTVALAPLKKFGIEEITVSTYQAVSGAGYPGLPAMDITGSVIPHIQDEEEKMEKETKKILGIDPEIHATCIRVPALYGHLETVWVSFAENPEEEDILSEWDRSIPGLRTHSLPERTVQYIKTPGGVRNDLSFRGNPPGMQVFTGGVRKKGRKIGFHLLVNNLIRGGAGGSVANAELFVEKYGGTL